MEHYHHSPIRLHGVHRDEFTLLSGYDLLHYRSIKKATHFSDYCPKHLHMIKAFFKTSNKWKAFLGCHMLVTTTCQFFFCFHGTTAPSVSQQTHCRRFTITLRHTTFGGTILDEWSARRRDLYLKTHNTERREASTAQPEFEPVIPASQRPQTKDFDGAATGNGTVCR